MSLVIICLILGLALAIERILYLTLSKTNTKKLLEKIEEALKNLKDAYEKKDADACEAASTKLTNAFQAASQEMYNAANAQPGGAQAGPQPGQGAQGDNNANKDAEDVDFEEVK